jgi:predicted SAM-dependent methyltransferase
VRSTAEQRSRVLAEIQRTDTAHINEGDSPALKRAKQLIPHRVRYPLRKAATVAMRRNARAKTTKVLSGRQPVRLNIGSGFSPIDGWINIDLVGAPVDLAWDLERGLPFPDGSVDAVYSEHVFEHFPIAQALALTRDAVRALRPGGVFRVAVPDAGALLRSYAGTDDEEWALSRATRMQAVMSLFYEHGHCTMYDDELLVTLCELAGLADVETRVFGESRLDDAVPDSEHRRIGTIYVEGIKPDS